MEASFSIATCLDWGRIVHAGERGHTDKMGMARAGVRALRQGMGRNVGASAG